MFRAERGVNSFSSFFPFDAVSSLVLSLLTINSSLEFIGYMIGIT